MKCYFCGQETQTKIAITPDGKEVPMCEKCQKELMKRALEE